LRAPLLLYVKVSRRKFSSRYSNRIHPEEKSPPKR